MIRAIYFKNKFVYCISMPVACCVSYFRALKVSSVGRLDVCTRKCRSISTETRGRVQTPRTLRAQHCVPFRFNPRAIQQDARSHPDRMWRYKREWESVYT